MKRDIVVTGLHGTWVHKHMVIGQVEMSFVLRCVLLFDSEHITNCDRKFASNSLKPITSYNFEI